MRKSRCRISVLIVLVLVTTVGNIPAAHAQKPPPRGVVPAGPQPTSMPEQHGAYYVLVIGIKNYQTLPKLETPVNDTNAVAEALRGRYGFEVDLLLDASRHKQAMSWYGKAAMLGYTPAMTALGLLYERGLGVERDSTQAANWYRKAAGAGDNNAAAKLQALGELSSSNSTLSSPRMPIATAAPPALQHSR